MGDIFKKMNLQKLVAARKYLHQNPELSENEENTAKYILEFLEEFPPDNIQSQIGGQGILATYFGKKNGNHIAFRCELDALPIQEINDFQHKSQTQGISHKCGHDGHMCIMLALAMKLHDNRPEFGKVSLLFQPAEENGRGAVSMLADTDFEKNFNPDFIFALHNVPGEKLHSIHSKSGIFTPSVISLKCILKGKTSHAAEPEKGINPAKAIAEIINNLDTLQNTNKNSEDFALITVVEAQLGMHWYGISAGEGFIGLTIRTWSNEKMDALKNSLTQLCQEIATKHQLKYEFDWFDEFRANNNNKQCHDYIMQAAKSLGLEHHEMGYSFKWGEDFGLFTEKFRGAMFALGAGIDTPALHNPDYDFPDELIESGAKMFHKISELATK